MIYAPDTTTWRVYSAEQSIDGGTTFARVDEAIAFGASVITSKWWSDRYPYPDAHNITICEGGHESPLADGGTIAESFAAPDRQRLPRSWRIELHPRMLQELVVLHELAHCVAPRHDGDVAGLRNGEVLAVGLPSHGPMFTATLAALLREFGSGRTSSDLAEAYTHFEVPLASEPDLRSGIERGLAIEKILAGWLDRERAVSARQPTQIPIWTLGDVLRAQRARIRPRISQSTIATAISVIQPCSRHQIARLENAATVPDDRNLRRIAMALVALLNIDPVHARHHLGLVRWECDIALDELRLVSPGWVDLVEHLNALAKARPPLWSVPGER